MNEFEHRLHDMLQERGSQPLSTPQAPPKVLRRARRRQLSTALVSGMTAVAVIGGAILGVQAFGRGTHRGVVGTENGPGSTRTVTLDGYGITYPYDWALQRVSTGFVVDPGGPIIRVPMPTATPVGPSGPSGVTGPSGPTGVSGVSGVSGTTGADGRAGGDTAAGSKTELKRGGQYLQLSNLYPDHLLKVGCSSSADFPSTGVVLTVRPIEGTADPTQGLTESVPDCATSTRFYEGTVVVGGVTFEARAAVGSDASQADHDALFAAYDSITYPPATPGVFMGGSSGSTGVIEPDGAGGDRPNAVTPPHASESVSTVVAGGTTEGGSTWVMLTGPDQTSFEVELGNSNFGWASASASGEPTPALPDIDASVGSFDPSGTPIVYGSVIGDASRVEVRPDGGGPIDVPLLPAPAVTGIDRSYFLSELPDLSSTTGQVVALDAGGTVIGHQDYDVSGGGSPPGPPICAVPTSTGGGSDPTCVPPTIECPVPAGSAANYPPDCPTLPIKCPVADGGDGTVRECLPCAEASQTSGGQSSFDCPAAPPDCPESTMAPDGRSGAGCAGGGFVCPSNAMCATPESPFPDPCATADGCVDTAGPSPDPCPTDAVSCLVPITPATPASP